MVAIIVTLLGLLVVMAGIATYNLKSTPGTNSQPAVTRTSPARPWPTN